MFHKINSLKINGNNETQKEYIHKACKMITFILRKHISEKIGMTIPTNNVPRNNFRKKQELKTSIQEKL
jgi:hypothetical protein